MKRFAYLVVVFVALIAALAIPCYLIIDSTVVQVNHMLVKPN